MEVYTGMKQAASLVVLHLKVQYMNTVMRKINEPKKDRGNREQRKLHSTKLHYSFSSSDIITVLKSMRVRWVGQVACMGVRTGL